MQNSTVIAVAIGGLGVCVAVGIVAIAIIRERSIEPHGVAITDTATNFKHDAIIAPQHQPKAPTLMDQRTLAGAMAFITQGAGQKNAGEHSTATLALAGWGLMRMSWSDVSVTEDETSYALAQKNIDSARGKRLCISGSIVQIEESKVNGRMLGIGLMRSSASNIFSFMNVGSSGKLVEQSWARFCAVVVDKYDYPNSAGGEGHAIDVVGLFDLPENRVNHGF